VSDEPSLSQRSADLLDWGQKLKDGLTHDGKPGLLPILDIWRDDYNVATCFVMDYDGQRSKLERWMASAVLGFRASSAMLLLESWAHVGQGDDREGASRNPDTGKPWAPGGMQKYREDHGPDNDVVGEALIVYGAARDGETIALHQLFTTHSDAVHWKKRSPIMEPDGPLPSVMIHALAHQSDVATAEQQLLKAWGDDQPSPETVLAITDCATVRGLKVGLPCMINLRALPDETERMAVIEELSGQKMRSPEQWSRRARAAWN
jgi:hypothetical protein